MTSAIPLTHDELLRSLTQGDYPQKQQEPQNNFPQDEIPPIYSNSKIVKNGKVPKTKVEEDKFVPVYAHEVHHQQNGPQLISTPGKIPQSETFIPVYAHPSKLPMKMAPPSEEDLRRRKLVQEESRRKKEFDEEFHRRLQMKNREEGNNGGTFGRNSNR